MYEPTKRPLDLPTNKSKSHTYEDLKDSDSFRLLDIEPGFSSEQLKCKLRTEHLNSHEAPYSALSYTWGSPTDREVIQLNGVPFSISKNLYDALKTIRHIFMTVTCWVDAICIDQENYAERKQQVTIMRSIYQKASNVVVWLGNDEGGDLQLASELIFKLAQLYSAEGVGSASDGQ